MSTPLLEILGQGQSLWYDHILGVLGRRGRDKVTLISSPGISDIGAWLEQLLAESSGKQGQGLIPVDRERLGSPGDYGDDRVFVYLRLESAFDADQDRAVDALAKVGHPVIRISIAEPYDLVQEFFRWEIATAVAGSILGINPFDQPDVEASEVETCKLTTEYEKMGSLPPDQQLFDIDGMQVYATGDTARALAKAQSLADCLHGHLGTLLPGDYFAILAYVAMNAAHEEPLQEIRYLVVTNGESPRASVSVLVSCTPQGKRTRVAHRPGCSCRSLRTMPRPPGAGTHLHVRCGEGGTGSRGFPGAHGSWSSLRVHQGPDVMAGLSTLRAAAVQALG